MKPHISGRSIAYTYGLCQQNVQKVCLNWILQHEIADFFFSTLFVLAILFWDSQNIYRFYAFSFPFYIFSSLSLSSLQHFNRYFFCAAFWTKYQMKLGRTLFVCVANWNMLLWEFNQNQTEHFSTIKYANTFSFRTRPKNLTKYYTFY